MKYRVSRTSTYNLKPCREAKPETIVYKDIRNTDDPKKIPANNGTDGDWWDKGTNHRTEHGWIVRDLGTTKIWTIEIETLEDLMKFCSKYGNLVIETVNMKYELPSIEIYDDYRE